MSGGNVVDYNTPYFKARRAMGYAGIFEMKYKNFLNETQDNAIQSIQVFYKKPESIALAKMAFENKAQLIVANDTFPKNDDDYKEVIQEHADNVTNMNLSRRMDKFVTSLFPVAKNENN